MFLALALVAAVQNTATTTSTEPEKKICRQVQSTGSIMRKRECHTKSEWGAISERNKQNTERAIQERDSTF